MDCRLLVVTISPSLSIKQMSIFSSTLPVLTNSASNSESDAQQIDLQNIELDDELVEAVEMCEFNMQDIFNYLFIVCSWHIKVNKTQKYKKKQAMMVLQPKTAFFQQHTLDIRIAMSSRLRGLVTSRCLAASHFRDLVVSF